MRTGLNDLIAQLEALCAEHEALNTKHQRLVRLFNDAEIMHAKERAAHRETREHLA